MTQTDGPLDAETAAPELEASTYFAGLTPEGRRGLVAYFGPRRLVPDGTVVCEEGTPAERWWVVFGGTADVTVDGRYVATIGQGEIVGDVSLLDGGRRSATVTAREQLVVAELDASTFEKFLDDVPGFERALLRQMVVRLRATSRRPADDAPAPASTASGVTVPDDMLSVLANPDFYQSPYPYYAALRENARLHWDEALELWFASRYDDARFVLRDRRFTNDPSEALATPLLRSRTDIDDEMGIGALLLHCDGDEHVRLRRLFSQILTPKRIDVLRNDVSLAAREALERGRDSGEIDLVADLAIPLPTHTISRLLGFPPGDEEMLHGWSLDLAAIGDPLLDPAGRSQVLSAARAMGDYLTEQIEARRTRPTEDALSELVALAPGGGVNDVDLLHNTMLLYIAGHTTTSAVIASGAAALAAAPEQWERLRDEPGLVANAVEEFLRFDAPVPFSRRYALEDVDLGPVTIGAGQSVAVCLAAANRDPRQFGGDSEFLRVARRGAHEHLSFAAGRHFCIGAGLGRLEAQVVLEALTDRWERIELLEPIVWRESFIARIPVSLRVGA